MTKRDGPMTPKAEEQISEKISRRLLSGDQAVPSNAETATRLTHDRRSPWPPVLDRCCDRERDDGRGQDELGDEHDGIEMGDKQVDGEVDQGALHPPCS
jgi:hypothetical protein